MTPWIDPAGFGGGMNWYAFVGNNPISFIDPFGLDKQTMDTVHVYGKPWTALDEASYQNWLHGSKDGAGGFAYGFWDGVGGALGYGGVLAGGIEVLHSGGVGSLLAKSGAVWLGKDGKFHSVTFNGNGTTGGRLAYAGAIADIAHTAGNIVGVAGVGLSVLQGYNAFKANDEYGMFQAGADVTMGVVGFLGPVGWAASTGYFVGETIDRYTGASDAIANGIINYHPPVTPNPVAIYRGSL